MSVELTPNSIHRINTSCVITFYVKNSLRLQYSYDSINLFHSHVENIVNLPKLNLIDMIDEIKAELVEENGRKCIYLDPK
jgi:hypothetical protein